MPVVPPEVLRGDRRLPAEQGRWYRLDGSDHCTYDRLENTIVSGEIVLPSQIAWDGRTRAYGIKLLLWREGLLPGQSSALGDMPRRFPNDPASLPHRRDGAWGRLSMGVCHSTA